MGVFRKNQKWWVDYTFQGKRIRKPVSTKKSDALDYLAKVKSDILYRKHPLPRNEKVPFFELAEKYLSLQSMHKKSFKTDIALMKPLVSYFGNYIVNEITIEHIDLYKNERLHTKIRKGKKFPEGKPISKTTINRELALMRNMFNKAVEWGMLSWNSIARIKLYKEEPKERILTEKEIGKLVSMAKPPLKDIILVAINTGMRKGEILNLKWDYVNLEEKFIETRSKTNKIRIIPINDALAKILSRLSLKREGREHVFENLRTNKPFTDVKKSWATLLEKAGIKDFRFHDLRHCFATYTLLKGGDLISLREILGHSDIKTTGRYAKAMFEGQQRLVKGFQVGEKDGEVIDFPEEIIKKTSS